MLACLFPTSIFHPSSSEEEEEEEEEEEGLFLPMPKY